MVTRWGYDNCMPLSLHLLPLLPFNDSITCRDLIGHELLRLLWSVPGSTMLALHYKNSHVVNLASVQWQNWVHALDH